MPAHPQNRAWRWKIGTIVWYDNGTHLIIVKKKNAWVYFMKIDMERMELLPWSRRMKIRDFDFMICRGAYRHCSHQNHSGWLRLNTKPRRDAIRAQLEYDYPHVFLKMESFA